MKAIGGFVFGLIAGVVGAILWAAIAYYGNVEIGYLAWGIGAAVGFAVSLGSRNGGLAPAAIAILITIASLCGGKFLTVKMAFANIGSEQPVELPMSDNDCITSTAFQLIESKEAAGEKVAWKNGMDYDTAEKLEDLPTDIVKEASASWNKKSDAEKAQYKADRKKEIENAMAVFTSAMTKEGFLQSFSEMDLIFFLLGIATAGKIAFSDPIRSK